MIDSVNKLIISAYNSGLSSAIYDVFFALGFVSVFLVCLLYGTRIGLGVKKSIITVLIVYPVAVFWMFFLFWAESGFTNFGGNNIVRVFVYVPLIAYPVAKLLKEEWKTLCDLLAFGPIAVHGISHFGCIFDGCCYGYPYENGVYNILSSTYCFPIQPIEAIAAVLIIVILLIRAKKNNFVPTAETYPLMLVMFGSSRFFFEFMRDNEKIFMGCSSLSFHALFMFVVGVIALIVIRKKKAAESENK